MNVHTFIHDIFFKTVGILALHVIPVQNTGNEVSKYW